jgi:hypothetical protein
VSVEDLTGMTDQELVLETRLGTFCYTGCFSVRKREDRRPDSVTHPLLNLCLMLTLEALQLTKILLQ